VGKSGPKIWATFVHNSQETVQRKQSPDGRNFAQPGHTGRQLHSTLGLDSLKGRATRLAEFFPVGRALALRSFFEEMQNKSYSCGIEKALKAVHEV
jgi:hypothetical protein